MIKSKGVPVTSQAAQAQLERTRNEDKPISGREYCSNADSQGVVRPHPQRSFFFEGLGKLFSGGNKNPAERHFSTSSTPQKRMQSSIDSSVHSLSSATGTGQQMSHAERAYQPDALSIECIWDSKENNLKIENPECRKIIFAIQKQNGVVVQSKEKSGKEYVATLGSDGYIIKRKQHGILGLANERFAEHNFAKALASKLNAVRDREEVISKYPSAEKYGHYVDALKDIADSIDIPKNEMNAFSQRLLEMSELHRDILNKFSSASDLGDLHGLKLKMDLASMITKIEGEKRFISKYMKLADKGAFFKDESTLSRASAALLKDIIDSIKGDSAREFDLARNSLLKMTTNEMIISKINEIDLLKTEAENGYEAAKYKIDVFLKSKDERLHLQRETSPLNEFPEQTVGNVFLAVRSLIAITTLLESDQGLGYQALARLNGSAANQKLERLNALATRVQDSSLSGKRLDEFKGELLEDINSCVSFFKEKSMISSGYRTQTLEALSDWIRNFKYGQA